VSWPSPSHILRIFNRGVYNYVVIRFVMTVSASSRSRQTDLVTVSRARPVPTAVESQDGP
jgi:hypothetical protein